MRKKSFCNLLILFMVVIFPFTAGLDDKVQCDVDLFSYKYEIQEFGDQDLDKEFLVFLSFSFIPIFSSSLA